MTPKEKADELVNKYYGYYTVHMSIARKCALIAVDEVLKYSKSHGFIGLTEEYQQVKQEIEKL